MSYMSELAILAEEGGLAGHSVEDLVEAARDIMAAPAGAERAEWVQWANDVLSLVNDEVFRPKHADYPHEPDTLYDCPACNMPD